MKPGALDIGIALGAGEPYGRASHDWMAGLLGRRFRDPASGESIRNFTRGSRFTMPDGRLQWLVRADFADQHMLTPHLGSPVLSAEGRNQALATGEIAALAAVRAPTLAAGFHQLDAAITLDDVAGVRPRSYAA